MVGIHQTCLVVGIVADAPVKFSTVEYEEVVIRLQNATLGGNRARRVHVVAGYHAHCDAGTLTLADCVRHLQTRTYQCVNICQRPLK